MSGITIRGLGSKVRPYPSKVAAVVAPSSSTSRPSVGLSAAKGSFIGVFSLTVVLLLLAFSLPESSSLAHEHQKRPFIFPPFLPPTPCVKAGGKVGASEGEGIEPEGVLKAALASQPGILNDQRGEKFICGWREEEERGRKGEALRCEETHACTILFYSPQLSLRIATPYEYISFGKQDFLSPLPPSGLHGSEGKVCCIAGCINMPPASKRGSPVKVFSDRKGRSSR